MPGCVDEVQVVDLPITRFVLQRRRLRLDGDAPLALDVHGVEHLRFHLTITQSTTALNDSISQGALAVIDVGNDGEVADVVHGAWLHASLRSYNSKAVVLDANFAPRS